MSWRVNLSCGQLINRKVRRYPPRKYVYLSGKLMPRKLYLIDMYTHSVETLGNVRGWKRSY